MARAESVPRNRVAVTAFVVCTGGGLALTVWLREPWTGIIGFLIGLYFLLSLIHI